MPYIDAFRQVAQKSKDEMENDSVAEAHDKISRLKSFYKDPYEDGSERWWMAEFALDYLMQYKTDGDKRKDGYTADIIHELNQLILQKSLVEASNHTDDIVIPKRITHEIIDGEKRSIPKAKQSAERLFVATTIHDVDEDFYDSSVEEFHAYMRNRIDTEKRIPEPQRQSMYAELEADCEAMNILTFGRKTRDDDGNEVKEKTFDGDRNLYMDAVEATWATVATKATDKLDSLTSRYGLSEDYFTIEQDILHIDETHRLFKQRQILENAAERYPQLSEYFHIMTAKLNVADRCLEGLTLYHPKKLEMNPDPEVNPLTAKIDVRVPLDEAILHSEFLPQDSWMLKRMLEGFQIEATKYPALQGLVDQMIEQYEAALEAKNGPEEPIPDDNLDLSE